MLDEQTREQIADEIYRCYREVSQIELLNPRYPSLEAEDSYKIQERVVARFGADGAPVKGYKVGLTSKPMQEMAGTDEPDYSAIPSEFFFPEASEIPFSRFNTPMVEIELAFVMKERLSGPGINVVDAIRAIDFALPAIEVVDFRVARAPGMDVRDTIADLAAVGAVVLGGRPMPLTAVDLRAVEGSLIINDATVESGCASAVLGNPLNAVVWLANKLGEFGVSFEPGDVVLSGSFIRIAPVALGDCVVADFGSGFGRVHIDFV